MLFSRHLESLSNVEPGASHFHFAGGPANDVAGPAAWGSCAMTEMLFALSKRLTSSWLKERQHGSQKKEREEGTKETFHVMGLLVGNSDALATCSQGKKRKVVGERNRVSDTSSHVATFYPNPHSLLTCPVPTLRPANDHLHVVCGFVYITPNCY